MTTVRQAASHDSFEGTRDFLEALPSEEQLQQLAASKASQFASANPFPHVVLDNFLRGDFAERADASFPTPNEGSWLHFRNADEHKLACNKEQFLPPAIREVLAAFHSQRFLRFLETLTGIPNLLADMHLQGGGMHQIEPGGFLGIHVDFNKLKGSRLDRRLNGILYLNRDWKKEFGGNLELWATGPNRCVQSIEPLFNRFVLFVTNPISLHGHPNPLQCPPDRTRKSIAAYYYTNGREDEGSPKQHSTVFLTGRGVPMRKGLLYRALRRVGRWFPR